MFLQWIGLALAVFARNREIVDGSQSLAYRNRVLVHKVTPRFAPVEIFELHAPLPGETPRHFGLTTHRGAGRNLYCISNGAGEGTVQQSYLQWLANSKLIAR